MKSINRKPFLNDNSQIDMDPYSTSILQELLQNNQEWRGTQQIIQLTMRAMSGVLEAHGKSLKDIKSVLTTRASKSQLTTGLSLKANISDISQTIDEISSQLDEVPCYSDLNKLLKDYIPRSQMTKALAQKHYQMEHVENQLRQEKKSNGDKYHVEIQIIKVRLEEFQKEIARKLANSVTLNQFQQILNIFDAKANFNQVNQTFATKQYLNNCLQKKINKTQLQQFLQTKADVNDIEFLASSLQTKVNLTTLEKLTQVIQNKVDRSDLMLMINQKTNMNRSQQRSQNQDSTQKLQSLREQFSQQVHSIRCQLSQLQQRYQIQSSYTKRYSSLLNQLQDSIHIQKLQSSKSLSEYKIQHNQIINIIKSQLKNLNQEINSRKTNDTINRQLNNQIIIRKRSEEKIYQEIDQIRKKLQQYHHHTNDQITTQLTEKNNLNQLKNQIINTLESKVQKDTFHKALKQLSSQLTVKFEKQNQTTTYLLQKLQKTYSQAISTNTNDIIKVTKSLTKKQDKYQHTIMQQNIKKSRKQIQQCRKTVDLSYQQLQSKLSIGEYESDLLQIKKRLDTLSKCVQQKASIKDVCTLADSKPNITDINTALSQLNQSLNQKISQTQLQSILKDQSLINQTLCSQNIVGRWIWQSGIVKPGGLVPWEIQSANTVPEHFFWEEGKTSVLILAPGIYEVKACVFNKQSILTLLINGQNLHNNNDQNANTINNPRSKPNTQLKKKAKGHDICGNKVQHFVILPARSRVSVSCLGDIGEGFLNIKRL